MKNFKGFIIFVIVLALTWLLLTGSLEKDELLIGGFSLVLVAILFFGYSDLYRALKISPKIILFYPLYLLVFLKELIVANFDVASRVIRPSLPINPGIVAVKTSLKDPLSKLILANSITLTPGTLTVDVKDDTLFIHWIDVKGKDVEEATKEISRKFEKILKEIVK